MRLIVAVAVLAIGAGCAHDPDRFRRFGGLECRDQPDGERVKIECRTPNRPDTTKAMLVGDSGASLSADLVVKSKNK